MKKKSIDKDRAEFLRKIGFFFLKLQIYVKNKNNTQTSVFGPRHIH